MNLVEKKLSAMPVGSPVRLIQANGQIIEGVLSENDKTTALEVTVTAKVTLMYSQITGIEENNAFGANIAPVSVSAGITTQPADLTPTVTDTAVKKQKETKTKSDIKLTCTEYDLKSSFKMMEKDAKSKLNPILNKVAGAIKAHDESKFKECANLSWDIIKANEYEENPEVNLFYAYVCAFAEEYYDSSLSFYYANDLRNAYRAAYYGASKNDDAECYKYAAIFAAIYCKEQENEFIDEAVEVIKFSSEKLKDIGGIRYLVSMNPTDSLKKPVVKAIRYLADSSGTDISSPDDLNKSVSVLETYYSGNKIAKEIQDFDNSDNENEKTEQVTIPAVTSEPKELEGKITKYNFSESKGKITANNGKVYEYELSDIADSKLRDSLKSTLKWDSSKTIPVRFKTSRKWGMDYAVEIVKTKDKTKVVEKDPNLLYAQGKFEEAIECYRNKLDTPKWETVFAQIMNSYAALWNKNGDNGYSSEMAALIERMSAKGFTLMKSYEVIQQYYMKVQKYSDALDALNFLIENCDSADHSRVLNYIFSKARCYRHIKDFNSAISQLNDWLEIVKTNKISERYDMRKTTIFIELAELYYELEDYENAEKYANISSDSERKQSLLKKLDMQNQTVEDVTVYQEDDDDSASEESMMTLDEAYEEYNDDVGFSALGIDDSIVAEKISVFDKQHLYSLITWLTAVSRIAKNSEIKGESVLHSELTMLQAIQSIEGAFSYAYQNPLADCDYTSSQVINLYRTSKNLLPEYNEELMVSAILRTLFNPKMQDYYLDDLICTVEISDVSNKYPVLVNLLSEIKKFFDNTGCAIDSFAGYRSNANVIDSVIQEAKELCETIDRRIVVYESQGQVRRLREYMLSDEQSVLRKCLNIVAENNVSEFKYVRTCMEDKFIRNNRSLTADNIDSMKIDALIDEYWDKARDVILSEGRHVSRPHDKIKGSKRTNIISIIRKVISCICDWLAVAEHSGNAEEAYIMQNYDTVAPQIISMLKELYDTGNNRLKENGFNWGTDSICTTANELLAKMEGTYNAKQKKYFFLGFLSGEDILLDENYFPELESTFCGWGKMNILSRIEHHAVTDNVLFEERLRQITSKDETKHNFRSAKLIMEYAEDTGNSSVTSVISPDEVNKCFKLVKQRFETIYEEFCDEVELFENYGIISNMNGEKDAVQKLAFAWYKISRITGDYGFYIKMLDFINVSSIEKISQQGIKFLLVYQKRNK